MTISTKMSPVASVLAIILLIINLPTEIGCCSLTTNEIISLMSHNPDFRHDPCYIEWEASQNDQLSQVYTRREKFPITLEDYYRMEEKRRYYEDRQQSTESSVPKKKETSVWKVLGILVGIMVSISCFAVCVAIAHSDRSDASPPTITNYRQSEPLSVTLTSAVDTNAVDYTNLIASTTSLNQQPVETNVRLMPTGQDSLAVDFTNLIASPTSSRQQPVGTNGQLMPTRQDSLPSYEDAVKMPSAPREQ